MIKRKILFSGIAAIICFIWLSLFLRPYTPCFNCEIVFEEKEEEAQIYWGDNVNELNEEDSKKFNIDQVVIINTAIISNNRIIRVDLGTTLQKAKVNFCRIKAFPFCLDIIKDDVVEEHDVHILNSGDGYYEVQITNKDPYISFDISNYNKRLNELLNRLILGLRVALSILLWMFVFWQYEHIKILFYWVIDILQNCQLIIELAISDFRTRYASSYLGMLWAFVQPIVTVVIYIIVFGYGFKTAPVRDFPFVLWLIAGILPWFFFSEALLSATNVLIEYGYLVKKVIFEIKILPLVKIVASLMIHIFFVVLVSAVFILKGVYPSLYYIQLLYYLFCLTSLLLGLSYFTAAMNVFVPDLSQIINVVLQFGMWMTPIMWSPSMFGELAEKIIFFNPLYYIVEGYRDCLYNKIAFWEKPGLTLYFWFINLAMLIFGMYTFRKLERHFADVL